MITPRMRGRCPRAPAGGTRPSGPPVKLGGTRRSRSGGSPALRARQRWPSLPRHSANSAMRCTRPPRTGDRLVRASPSKEPGQCVPASRALRNGTRGPGRPAPPAQPEPRKSCPWRARLPTSRALRTPKILPLEGETPDEPCLANPANPSRLPPDTLREPKAQPPPVHGKTKRKASCLDAKELSGVSSPKTKPARLTIFSGQ